VTYYLLNHHTSGHLTFVLVSAESVLTCAARWEVGAVFGFPHAMNVRAGANGGGEGALQHGDKDSGSTICP
jgi:hypothetical protein